MRSADLIEETCRREAIASIESLGDFPEPLCLSEKIAYFVAPTWEYAFLC
jgi:hypothetical protein